jgi:hypothetical protein
MPENELRDTEEKVSEKYEKKKTEKIMKTIRLNAT